MIIQALKICLASWATMSLLIFIFNDEPNSFWDAVFTAITVSLLLIVGTAALIGIGYGIVHLWLWAIP